MDLNAAVRADSLTLAEFQSMDTETMLYFVQLKRATDLEDKLREKMEKVAKNIDNHGADSTKINDNLNEIARMEKTGQVDPSKFQDPKGEKLLEILKNPAADGSVTLTNEQIDLLNERMGMGWGVYGTTDIHVLKEGWSYSTSNKDSVTILPVKQSDGNFKITVPENVKWQVYGRIETTINWKVNGKDTQTAIDKAISDLKTENESLKVKVDTATNLQQLDMIELQQLMTNMNQAFDMVSNAMKKFAETKGGIIRNM
ncbi:hypothetical protein G7048_09380 [Diaphorobacter sp. HDW4B]|uniref:hypothetical protein n=1 Tax=Diaphorobacter sp. HDW4B TaxID=2714925 RepID=UPI001409D953|nr:hypothetical protein [Diaphorobacter sp. HDW4B]QIL70547.1 hypothetical protein G7048_09380 [Diaphorobacter sp. HDW4B]